MSDLVHRTKSFRMTDADVTRIEEAQQRLGFRSFSRLVRAACLAFVDLDPWVWNQVREMAVAHNRTPGQVLKWIVARFVGEYLAEGGPASARIHFPNFNKPHDYDSHGWANQHQAGRQIELDEMPKTDLERRMIGYCRSGNQGLIKKIMALEYQDALETFEAEYQKELDAREAAAAPVKQKPVAAARRKK